MKKWHRIQYHPNLPLYAGQERVTGSAAHLALSRQAAAEGAVLLKNNGHLLPFAFGKKIALFGKGCVDYVKGGGGSGDVTTAYLRTLCEGMAIKQAEGKVRTFAPLEEFYRANVAAQYQAGALPGLTAEPAVPEELLCAAAKFTDTAVVTLCRFSGEGWDRKAIVSQEGYQAFEEGQLETGQSDSLFENGDFYLTHAEEALIRAVKAHFSHIVVLLNVGGVVDTSWFAKDNAIQSVLIPWQGGIEGGLAMADLLCGDQNPSGKLADTFAASLEAYPSTATFHESVHYVDYTDDIYIGYRYFESSDQAKQQVNYPFGFGLSYTTFAVEVQQTVVTDEELLVRAIVTNTGGVAGKEVLQLYYGAPQGKLGQPHKVLGAFQKTRLLQAGESQTMTLTLPFAQMASFDTDGVVAEAAMVLEAGDYRFYLGTSVADTVELPGWTLDKPRVVEQLSHQCVPHLPHEDGEGLPRQNPDELEGILPQTRAIPRESWEAAKGRILLADVAAGKASLEEFFAQLTLEQQISLLGGQPNVGVANTFGMGNLPEYGVPNLMTADGPAGLRISRDCEVYTTAWPCATLLACSWDVALAEAIGRAAGEEVKENGFGMWLAPALNIHRSPLCGRNFEYYSEDPLLAGKMGAAVVRGVQSVGVSACPKHFAANNKETNRKASDSRVSERALREIYLRAFEIVVKEADPYAIMSSYNLVNGVQASENKDLLTHILRDEWGFRGVVTTDWWTKGEHYREIKAGNDIKMANGYPERVLQAYEQGYLSAEEIAVCAKRVLELFLKLD